MHTLMLVKSVTLSTKNQGCLIAMLSNEFIPSPTLDVVESRIQE